MSEIITIIETESVQVVEIESVEIGVQGPPGPPGVLAPTGIDIVSGGAPDTDFSAGYIFEGGAP
jgi:hypothetical protein